MSAKVSFLAVDIGASSGRVIDCSWNGKRFSLQEVHRFPNGGVRFGSSLHWDVLRIWSEIQTGLKKFRSLQSSVPAGIGVDAWGVDYCLLDEHDRLLGNPYHYRDSRTKGLPATLQSLLSAHDLFHATGVQTMEINTSFQLASMAMSRDRQLLDAHSLLMIPDLFQFLLSGEKSAEYTEATTTQLYDLRSRCWSSQLINKLKLPPQIFQKIVLPGTILGDILPCVQADCGFWNGFPSIAIASHDTASAVAAIPDLDENSIFLSSGTWSLMGIPADEPNMSEGFFRSGFTNEGSADGGVLLLRNLTGLWILQECARIWDDAGTHHSWTALEEAASNAPHFRSFIDPSASELQSPPDMCAAVQAFCARSAQPIPESPGDIARCIFESLSFAYHETIESFEAITGRTLSTIRIVGGGCLNHFLCQMTADACRREVIAGPVEAAALGNAIVQAVATRHLNNLDEGRAAVKQSLEFQTYSPARVNIWQEAFDRYKSIVAQSRNQESLAGQT